MPRNRTAATAWLMGLTVVVSVGLLPLLASDPAAAAAGAAATVSRLSVVATKDATVDLSHPALANGGASALTVGDATTDRHVAYVGFTVSGLPANARVLAAELDLHALSASPSLVAVQARSAGTAWSEATVTAATAPTPGPVLGSAYADVGGTTAIDVDGWISGNGTYALALRLGAASQASATLAARESGAAAPTLIVTYDIPPAQNCADGAALGTVCGVLLGTTVNQVGSQNSPTQALTDTERDWQRGVAVVHTYHSNDQAFPTTAEIAMTTDPTHPRLLATNWKPATRLSWGAIAAGQADARIDAEAKRLVAYERPLLLAIQHEPEDSVRLTAGSGYTPADYVAMFRHVVARLRADGVTNVAFVWDTMGFRGWGEQGYYDALYPGDDVVDWIAADPYGADLAGMLTRSGGTWPGWYAWATTRHPGKPLALFEFGMPNPRMSKADEVLAYDNFAAQAQQFPALHLALHFNHAADGVTKQSCRYDDDPATLAAFRRMVADRYVSTTITS